MSQLIYPLSFTAVNPTSAQSHGAGERQPRASGPYMLFLVNGKGVPSKAKMVTVGP